MVPQAHGRAHGASLNGAVIARDVLVDIEAKAIDGLAEFAGELVFERVCCTLKTLRGHLDALPSAQHHGDHGEQNDAARRQYDV